MSRLKVKILKNLKVVFINELNMLGFQYFSAANLYCSFTTITYAHNEIPLLAEGCLQQKTDPRLSGVVIATSTYVCRFHTRSSRLLLKTKSSKRFTPILYPASNVSICELSMVQNLLLQLVISRLKSFEEVNKALKRAFYNWAQNMSSLAR